MGVERRSRSSAIEFMGLESEASARPALAIFGPHRQASSRWRSVGSDRARTVRRRPAFGARPYWKLPCPVRNAPAIPALGQSNVSTTCWPSMPVDRMLNLPMPNPLASVAVPSPAPRVSAVHEAWLALWTSIFVSGTRALRTQRLVQYWLDPVWNSYIIGPVSGHFANCHVMLRGYSDMLSAVYASGLV